jgi:hypothetical protein
MLIILVKYIKDTVIFYSQLILTLQNSCIELSRANSNLIDTRGVSKEMGLRGKDRRKMERTRF